MLHARKDYNRIQDPENLIGEDEPVFICRAKDQCCPETMRFWADLHEKSGGDPKMSEMVRKHADLAEQWQKIHGKKIADL